MSNLKYAWTKEQQPNEEIRYNHMLLSSPLGVFSSEWKGWKKYDDVCVYLDQEYLDSFDCIEEAIAYVDSFLRNKLKQLSEFLL